jgi:protein-S-isoprenylcysteine O-methyltransferase Ste14
MHERHGAALVVAWGSTVAFAASLSWFLYCYLFRFDTIHAAMTVPTGRWPFAASAWIDVLIFSLFALHHSVLARPRVKEYVYKLVPRELERSLYTSVASVLFIMVCTWWQPVAGTLYRLDGVWRVAGYLVQLVGLVLTMRVSQALDVFDLSGLRAVQRAAHGTASTHVPLKTTGLYGFVRHPLYFAWTLFVFAAPDMTNTRAVFALVSTAYLALAIPWEERALVRTFGQEYARYRRRVRWRMLPGVY